MRTKRGAFTWGAVIGKLALMLPAGTVRLGGKHGGVTSVPSMLPHTCRVTPRAGAGAVSVTVPVVLPPPRILVEASVSDERFGAGGGLPAGNSVSPVPGDLYPSNAVPASMLTCVGTGTGEVRTSNVAPVPPAGMKTDGGSVIRSGLLFTSVTSTP